MSFSFIEASNFLYSNGNAAEEAVFEVAPAIYADLVTAAGFSFYTESPIAVLGLVVPGLAVKGCFKGVDLPVLALSKAALGSFAPALKVVEGSFVRFGTGLGIPLISAFLVLDPDL